MLAKGFHIYNYCILYWILRRFCQLQSSLSNQKFIMSWFCQTRHADNFPFDRNIPETMSPSSEASLNPKLYCALNDILKWTIEPWILVKAHNLQASCRFLHKLQSITPEKAPPKRDIELKEKTKYFFGQKADSNHTLLFYSLGTCLELTLRVPTSLGPHSSGLFVCSSASRKISMASGVVRRISHFILLIRKYHASYNHPTKTRKGT